MTIKKIVRMVIMVGFCADILFLLVISYAAATGSYSQKSLWWRIGRFTEIGIGTTHTQIVICHVTWLDASLDKGLSRPLLRELPICLPIAFADRLYLIRMRLFGIPLLEVVKLQNVQAYFLYRDTPVDIFQLNVPIIALITAVGTWPLVRGAKSLRRLGQRRGFDVITILFAGGFFDK